MIIGWNNNTLGFTSVFYDGKFVDVLLLAVFKKEELIGHEKLDNKKMRFVKGNFNLSFDYCSIAFFGANDTIYL